MQRPAATPGDRLIQLPTQSQHERHQMLGRLQPPLPPHMLGVTCNLGQLHSREPTADRLPLAAAAASCARMSMQHTMQHTPKQAAALAQVLQGTAKKIKKAMVAATINNTVSPRCTAWHHLGQQQQQQPAAGYAPPVQTWLYQASNPPTLRCHTARRSCAHMRSSCILVVRQAPPG